MDPIKEAMIRHDDGLSAAANQPLEKHPPAKARDRATLELQIMDSGIPKNDAEWWAKDEIETLLRVESIAREIAVECQGGTQAPALGTLARLEDALHTAWRRRL